MIKRNQHLDEEKNITLTAEYFWISNTLRKELNMAENKLTMDVKFENYDKDGFFICPLCPFDALVYGNQHCINCGLTLKWDSNLLKIKEVCFRSGKYELLWSDKICLM